ncbi:virulence factor TspB C-terminal domain-related protein [Nitrosomonas ureae]|nr:virulence factor TspB C-terminal domain-related protein [Nitrosomonas ureae]ALQ52075.1 hypothetical protein ATY38_13130 [Nitrosomonas ureae]
MANFHRLLTAIFFCLFFCSPALSQSAPVGAIDLAGWIKGADGAYTKAFGESAKITLSSPPGGISTTSTALINTSKGIQAMDIVKTAAVDVGRVGASVANLAKRVGPVGMSLTAVSLVCELTNICNDAGQWVLSNVDFGGTPGSYGSCQEAIGLAAGANWQACTDINNAIPNGFWFRSPAQPDSSAGCTGHGGTSWTYTGVIYTCTNPPRTSAPLQPESWDSKASQLNDDRFVPELIGKGESVPSNVPTLTPDQKKGLGLESKPTRDSSGNVTGREDTTTEIEAVDAGTTDNPGRVIIKETQTTIKYDINNNQINTTTNTSYSSQPQPDKPQQNFEIKFDEVPPAELQTHNVQATLTGNSWGEGTCPPDIPIDISYYPMNLVIPTAPVCDTAEKINPLVLLLASIAGVYIVSGVRSTEVK